MTVSEEDRRALRQALRQVKTLAEATEDAPDTETICLRLLRVRMAVLDAYALAQAVDENTRNAALREVETRLELRVGMELEHL